MHSAKSHAKSIMRKRGKTKIPFVRSENLTSTCHGAKDYGHKMKGGKSKKFQKIMFLMLENDRNRLKLDGASLYPRGTCSQITEIRSTERTKKMIFNKGFSSMETKFRRRCLGALF